MSSVREDLDSRVPAVEPARKGSGKRRSVWDFIPTPVAVAIFGLAVIAVWKAVLELGLVSPLILPQPGEVWGSTKDLVWSLITGGDTWDSFKITAKEVVLGFLIATCLGVGCAVGIAKTTFGERVIRPVMVALYSAPKIALAPVFVAWFGFGSGSKIAMAAVIGFFPLLVNMVAGLSSIDADEAKLFKQLRAGRLKTFVKLEMPTALPFMFAGLKSTAVLCVIGTIVGEFMGGGLGFGARIKAAASQLALDDVFGFVILLSLMAFAFYSLIDLLERRIVFWRPSGLGASAGA